MVANIVRTTINYFWISMDFEPDAYEVRFVVTASYGSRRSANLNLAINDPGRGRQSTAECGTWGTVAVSWVLTQNGSRKRPVTKTARSQPKDLSNFGVEKAFRPNSLRRIFHSYQVRDFAA